MAAQYRVLVRILLGDRLVDPGEIITLPLGVLPGRNLQPLDDEGAALQAKRQQMTDQYAPPGSTPRRAIDLELRSGIPLTEPEIGGLYHHPKKESPTPGGMVSTVTWAQAVEASTNLGIKP